MPILARVRSTRQPQPARLHWVAGEVAVDLLGEETGVAPGQACVFYADAGEGARVLGGGWIRRSERAAGTEQHPATIIEHKARLAV